jgi:hypothetical protein
MDSQTFRNISKIIERDSKSSTYKFALLRGVIDIIQDNSPYIFVEEKKVVFLTGLLVEKWFLYYYPILESEIIIPQIGANTKLAFAIEFDTLIQFYKDKGGFSAFYNDLRSKGIPNGVQKDFVKLVKKLKETITKNPMYYIGRSISDEFNSIFKVEPKLDYEFAKTCDMEYLLSNCGSFSIPIEYYEAFKLLGSFIGGNDSILVKWAEYSTKVSGGDLKIEKALNEILRSPITNREVEDSKKIYKDILRREGEVRCVWTQAPIREFDVDHMIPFSIWKNNDLWNLLPAKASVNNKKRDKIPSAFQLEKSKELIFHYWDLINQYQAERFHRELKITLIGPNQNIDWHQAALTKLKTSSQYLIEQRGFEGWEL